MKDRALHVVMFPWLPQGHIIPFPELSKRLANQWAPQQHIICHPSTGGFVSHCGWSSVLEALRFGMKIIALPMHLDQGLDAEELHIGMEIGREEDGSFKAEEISRCVREVMVGDQGRRMAENSEKMRESLSGKDEIQELYTREFIKHLL